MQWVPVGVSVLLLLWVASDQLRAGKLASFFNKFTSRKASGDDSSLPSEFDRVATLLELEKVRERAVASNRMDLLRGVDEAAKTLFQGEPEQ